MEKRGISTSIAHTLFAQYGPNEIGAAKKSGALRVLARQVKKNFIVYLLLIAAILAFVVGKTFTAYTILVVIALVVIIGFIQEYRAERALEALRAMATPVSVVLRDGREREIPSRSLVPGDILILRTGEKVPADCSIIEGNNVMVNESLLTGEAVEVAKSPLEGSAPQAANMLYMGTYIVNGRCIAQVLHTGMNTRFGAIAHLISTQEKSLPLQDKLNHIAFYITITALVFALVSGLLFLLRQERVNEAIIIEAVIVVIALAVSSFPEGLPVVLITTLSSGAARMARKNALVNRMSIIETLGETTVICSDKTGTITTGEMTVRNLFFDGRSIEISGAGYEGVGSFTENGKALALSHERVLSLLCKGAVVCNDASISRSGEDALYSSIGTPTESALLIMAAKAGIFRDDLQAVRKEELPFNSNRKLMSVLCSLEGNEIIFSKGAPEKILANCSRVERDDGVFTLTTQQKKRILEQNKQMNARSLRTLALAYKPAARGTKTSFEEDLIFLGLLAMEDPPHPQVREAVRLCMSAGISVKMITGDHTTTAQAIAREIGLHGKSMSGDELEELTDEELTNVVQNIVIFTRVKPEHKLRIVNALKHHGEIVTMTGDGVNDAPALKAAHIGVAMGKKGTDVARSVSDITLKDDNFSTIVAAIAEGRTIFDNMRKFVTYQLSCNYAQIICIFLAIVLGLPLPLVAIQILFMNLVTDDLPSITLGLNPHSNDIMSRKPRTKSEIITKDLIVMLIISGSIMGLGTLAIFYGMLEVLHQEVAVARTTALVGLICFEIANAFNFRSFRKGVLGRSLLVNKYLALASLASVVATLLVVYTPLNRFFETVPLAPEYLLIAVAPAFLIVVVFDILKKLNTKLKFWVEII